MKTDPQTLSAIEKITFAIIDGCFNLLALASSKKVQQISDGLGWLIYRLDHRHRKIALDNLEQAYGEEKTPLEKRKIAIEVFRNMVRMLFEISWLSKLDPKDVRRHIHLGGTHQLKAKLREGRGALMLLAHAGNWELLPALVLLTNVTVNVLYRPLDFRPVDRFLRNMRSRFGATMIRSRRSARQIIRALARGELVAILMDQNVDWYEGVFVDFFGRQAATNKGFALLALKTRAPVFPMFMIREKDGFRVEVGPEIPLIKTGDKSKDIEINTQRYNDVIERFVRRYPEQWFWVHQRWKTRSYLPWPRQAQSSPGQVKQG